MFKCLGVTVLVLGFLVFTAQITSWILISELLDSVASGLWGGIIVLFTGVLAIRNQAGFRALALMSVLSSLVMVTLHTWALIRILEDSKILVASRPLDWTTFWGRSAHCSTICEAKIITCPIIILLGVLVLIFSAGLVFQEAKREMPTTLRQNGYMDDVRVVHTNGNGKLNDSRLDLSMSMPSAPKNGSAGTLI